MLNCVLIWLKLLKTKYFAWIAMKSKLSCHVMYKNAMSSKITAIQSFGEISDQRCFSHDIILHESVVQ